VWCIDEKERILLNENCFKWSLISKMSKEINEKIRDKLIEDLIVWYEKRILK